MKKRREGEDTQSFLMVEQAAELAGTCEETIRRWCRSGKVRHKKTGRRLLIFTDEFLGERDFIEWDAETCGYVIG